MRGGAGAIQCRINIAGSNNSVRVGEGSSINDGTICIEDDGNEVIIGKMCNYVGKYNWHVWKEPVLSLEMDACFLRILHFGQGILIR